MISIIYSTGLNWFNEYIARAIHEDLLAEGVEVQLLTVAQLLATPPDQLGPGSDAIIVNFYESALSLISPTYCGLAEDHLHVLRERFRPFDRRILVNLDSLYTSWFQRQMHACRAVLTDVFDMTMMPQIAGQSIVDRRYTWVPECLTIAQDKAIQPYDDNKIFPWAMIGHATPPRAAVTDELVRKIGSQGLVFLVDLRPSQIVGSRNLTPDQLFRVLRQTRYYVWSSHHGYPYHEGLRALNAICNGSIPVKIEKSFSRDFLAVPWVYPDVDTLVQTIHEQGPAVMFNRAVEFIRSRGTLGRAFCAALGVKPAILSTPAATAPTL